jgi:trehalose 6-phosphate phosphatase
MRAILERVSPAATLVEALEPVRAEPSRGAVLLDVDGTLAPIVRHAADAHVPEATRSLLIAVARRYGLVACISGRRAANARQIVSIGSIAYVGNHGGELLRPGATEVELDPEVASWTRRINDFVAQEWDSGLDRLRVRREDKEAIAAFHWRGAPDEAAAYAAVAELARRAEESGLVAHWGRKVLEVRPPVELNKGRGVVALLRPADVDAALYVGDDTTDLDAFRGLRGLVDEGHLTDAICIGVRSDETPPALEQEADLLVDGPMGVRAVLDALLDV